MKHKINMSAIQHQIFKMNHIFFLKNFMYTATITTNTARTTIIPNPIPALKILSTTEHEVKRIETNKIIKKSESFGFGINGFCDYYNVKYALLINIFVIHFCKLHFYNLKCLIAFFFIVPFSTIDRIIFNIS